jgi:twitching motility protein PilI
MARKFNLRQFQTELSKRMQAAASMPTQISRLGFQVAGDNWLISLDEIDEVMPIPEIEPTPGTLKWFRGVSNIRGNLYAVSDLTHFLTGAPTQQTSDMRLLLIHRKHGINAAFIVQRALGLKQSGQFSPGVGSAAWPYTSASYVEENGSVWYELDIAGLLSDPGFLSVETQ